MRDIKKPIREVTLLLFVVILTLQGCSQDNKKQLSGTKWKHQIEEAPDAFLHNQKLSLKFQILKYISILRLEFSESNTSRKFSFV